VLIGKFKKRKNYHRKQGHRQAHSVVKVESIQGVG
jgi:ribosomal protein L21